MPILPYLALLACLLLIGLFAASEAVLAATNRVRLRHLLREQASPDDNATHLLSSELSIDAQQFIATVTVSSNVCLMLAAVLTTYLAVDAHGLTPLSGVLCAAIALGTVALFQVTPRLLVSQPRALEKLYWVRPIRLLLLLLSPPVGLLMLLGRALMKPLGLVSAPRGADDDRMENAEEIRDLVESAQASGVLEADGKELIESIFTFGDTRVHEVMIPRPDIVALPVDVSSARVLALFQESGFSRLPLFEDNIDHIVGILHVKDVLACLSRNEWHFSPRALLRPPLVVPESQKIDEALAAMRVQRTHLAIVMDEFGGTAGLLTVEDILEELVGDIADEHDHKTDDPLIILDGHTALVDALLHTEDLKEQWDLALPTGEFDTVGGFMIEQLGKALVAGDRLELPSAVLLVHSMRGRRPKKILITRKETPAPTEEEHARNS